MAAERLAAVIPPDPHQWAVEQASVVVRGRVVRRYEVFVCGVCLEVSELDPRMIHPGGRLPCKVSP